MFVLRKVKLSMFQKILISYVSILLTPFIVGSFLYREAVKIVEQDAKEFNMTFLEQSKNILDRRFEEIGEVSKQAAMNTKTMSIINLPQIKEGSKDIFKVWDLLNNLPQYRLTNNFISDIFIMYKNNEIVITSTGAYMDMPYFFKNYLNNSDMDYTKWKELLFNSYHRDELIPIEVNDKNNKSIPMLLHIQSMPLEFVTKPSGIIVTLINKQEIEKLLKNVNVGDAGLVFIMDSKERIISSVGGRECCIKPQEINTKHYENNNISIFNENGMMVSFITSPYNKWKYVSVVPESYVMKKVDYIKNISISITAVILIVGIFIASFLSYKSTKPVKDLVDLTKEFIGGDRNVAANEYDYIQNTLVHLIENNKSIHQQLEKQLPLLQAVFIRRLLNGEFYDEEEVNNYAANIKVDFRGKNFIVLIVRIVGYEDSVSKEELKELDILRMLLKNELTDYIATKCYSYDLDENKVANLVVLESDLDSECMEIVENISQHIYEKIGNINSNSTLLFAVGNIHKHILSTSISFYEARKALDYAENTVGKRIVWYKAIPKESENYCYPLELELRLINLIRAGEFEETEKLVEIIYKENFEMRKLSCEMAKQLLNEMKGTIIKVGEYLEEGEYIKKKLEKIDRAKNIEDTFKIINEVYNNICSLVKEKKSNSKAKFTQKVTEYIACNYMKEELNLAMVALEFEVSEAYMYQFFKKHVGNTFSNYLEELRMKYACELLNEEDLNIKDIAKMVGYNNDHSFRRAFKRINGTAPTDYRTALKA
jgi:two-component system, response regulator YesN